MDFTLADVFKDKNRIIPYDDKIRIFYKLVQAVSELEDAGIVHTNLNPNHILLSNDLKTVKICGLARAQMDIPKHHQVAKPIQNLKKDEVTFTAIDILASSKWCKLTSASDVWSLGLILAYILRDGVPLFSANGGEFLPKSVFSVLGNPTRKEIHALSLGLSHTIAHSRYVPQYLQTHMTTDENMAKWVPVLDAMLEYKPKKRIKIKDLLNHELFHSHFKEHFDSRIPLKKPSKMEQILIGIPQELYEARNVDAIEYVKSLVGTRQAVVEEWRISMEALLRVLSNSTPVPAEIWLNIFVLANVHRYF
jgi:serine/threonine protein kinase